MREWIGMKTLFARELTQEKTSKTLDVSINARPRLNITRLSIAKQILLANEKGGTYAAQIARELNLDKGYVTRCLKEFERLGIAEPNRKETRCYFCRGEGTVVARGETKTCLFCKGEGFRTTKTYPLFYTIPREKIPEVRQLIYGVVGVYGKV
ncbi:MAG: helix-turn-helix domain-containing protein [Candidatus Micrarchaeota archaeon]